MYSARLSHWLSPVPARFAALKIPAARPPEAFSKLMICNSHPSAASELLHRPVSHPAWLALLPALSPVRALTTPQVDVLASIHEFKLGGTAVKCKYSSDPHRTPKGLQEGGGATPVHLQELQEPQKNLDFGSRDDERGLGRSERSG